MNASWLSLRADEALLSLHVQPGASRTDCAGLHGDALKIRLRAPPVDGKANAALIDFLSGVAQVPKASVELVAGASGRRKTVRIRGLGPAGMDRLRSLAGD